MMLRWSSAALAAASLVMMAAPRATAAELPPATAQPFQPGDVKLLPGPFEHALQLDQRTLLSYEPDRLLAWYRKNAGLTPKAEVYGGWESQGIAGHCLGHYLSACARIHAATGNEEFRRRVEHILAELVECQRASGDGFLGAMPDGRRVFAEVSRGEIRSQGFDLNGSWVPWYNLHKLFAGLIDAHRYCKNEQALAVASGLADWAIAVTRNLDDGQWQRMLACEHGGMNESLAELSAITGNAAYLELAQKFYHRDVLDGLAEGRDTIANKHANTQIPKIIGAALLYELTGDEKFRRIAESFWQIVVAQHTYVTGGNSDGEHFGPPGRLSDRLGQNTTETCNVYNMLKLTAALFAREPHARYAEYAERALWNHILSARHPETGQVCYYLTLKPGATRKYVGDEDFTCCNGSGMETPIRTADYIYYRGASQLWVNQFIASEVRWQDAGATLRQETTFPSEPRTTLTVSSREPVRFTLHVRHPAWVAGPLAVTLNGQRIPLQSSPGSFVPIDRQWENGDSLVIDLPLDLHTEAMPDNPRRVAVFNGPILLAGDLREVDASNGSSSRVPVLVTEDRPPADWVEPRDERKLAFHTAQVGRPRDVPLLPFYAAHDMPATVYWDTFSENQWAQREAAYEAQRKREAELAERTVDLLAIGEMQAERDHNVQSEKSSAEEFNGRKLRHAWDGGWFSFDVAVPTAGDAELVVDYWGSETGPREFDVQVDGATIATTSLHQDAPGEFWQKSYALPAAVLAGKSKVNVRFQAKPGNYAGGVFGVRVVRPAP